MTEEERVNRIKGCIGAHPDFPKKGILFGYLSIFHWIQLGTGGGGDGGGDSWCAVLCQPQISLFSMKFVGKLAK